MYRSTIDFHDRIMRGEEPVPYALIQTLMGWRAYAESVVGAVLSVYIADGTYDADGSITAGSANLGLMEREGRLLSWSGFERTIQPRKSDVLSAYNRKQQQSISIMLDNSDNHFSKLVAKEYFLGRPMSIYVGFDALPIAEHLRVFNGQIFETELTEMKMTVRAHES